MLPFMGRREDTFPDLYLDSVENGRTFLLSSGAALEIGNTSSASISATLPLVPPLMGAWVHTS